MAAQSNAARQKLWRERHADQSRSRRNSRRSSTRKTNTTETAFIAFDGEGSDGKYQLLAASVGEPIIEEHGLSTNQCLSFFAKLIVDGLAKKDDAFIGFGLGYDFENILKDVPDEAYNKMLRGYKVKFGPWKLGYVQRKFLDVGFSIGGRYHSFRLNDIYPYFQTGFIKACEAHGIPLPQTVYHGKRQRSEFSYEMMDTILEYNRQELIAMVTLAETLRDDFVKAFGRVEVSPRIGKRDWYGPGAQAGAILKTLDYNEVVINADQRSAITTAVLNSYNDELFGWRTLKPEVKEYASLLLLTDPFSASYFGGRIEASLQGRLAGPLYDYDLISAYPYAMTLLPTIRDKELRPVASLDTEGRIGLYHVEWKAKDFATSPAYGPLPFRSAGGNVYFPVTGSHGWYLSPEVYALARSQQFQYNILEGFVFDGTEGYGYGDRKGDSTLAGFVELMGRVRAEAKADGDPAHRGLKLLMNSLYGKTLQKVGARTYFNAFVAGWITSVTRSRIYDLIKDTKPGEVVSIMTDGVLSRVPLDAQLGTTLGMWELKMYDSGYQLAPGIYTLDIPAERQEKEGPVLTKYRGFARFDAKAAIEAFENGGIYEVKDRRFVTRSMALHQPKLLPYLYHFVNIKRKEDFSLASKRMEMFSYDVADHLRYFEPKLADMLGSPSFPYDVIDDNETILKKLLEGTK